MSKRFLVPATIRALATGALFLLVACANETDCSDALDTARAAAQEEQPLGSWIGGVEDTCAGRAEGAWAIALAERCAPLHGFHAGHTGSEAKPQCTGADYQSALNLGEMLADMQAEADKIEKRLDDEVLPPETRRDLKRRRVVIGRDLPQLEALARIDGYLPPAEVPDSN